MENEPELKTLGYHRDMCATIFGPEDPSTLFLDRKIVESPNGRDEKVIADETQMVWLCMSLHAGGNPDLYKEIKWAD